MPNIASAKKRLRQDIKRRAKNRSVKSELKTRIRTVRDAATEGKADDAEAAFRIAAQKLDRAAAKRVIHPNKAARLKSRLSASMKAAKAKSE